MKSGQTDTIEICETFRSYLEQELGRGGTHCFSEETRLINALTKVDGTTRTPQPSPPALASDAVQLPAAPPDDIR